MTVSSTESVDPGTDIQEPDVTTADSSNANEGATSIYDAVNAALKGKEESPASEEPDPNDPDSQAPTDDDDELSEEEQQRLSERSQRRFRDLVERRKAAESQVAEIQQELEAIRPKAERMDELLGYMQANNIPPDHLNNALSITAMINKGNYASAIPVLESLLSQVKAAAGEVLPPDLQREVELGYITENRAKELHKSRLAGERAQQSAEEQRRQFEAERQRAEVSTLVETVTRAGDAWSAEKAKSDPDWNLKRDRVQEKVELELRRLGPEGYPRSAEAVRQVLEQALEKVEAEIRRYRPAPKQIDSSPTGGSASPRSAAQPKSLMEAVDMAIAKSG